MLWLSLLRLRFLHSSSFFFCRSFSFPSDNGVLGLLNLMSWKYFIFFSVTYLILFSNYLSHFWQSLCIYIKKRFFYFEISWLQYNFLYYFTWRKDKKCDILLVIKWDMGRIIYEFKHTISIRTKTIPRTKTKHGLWKHNRMRGRSYENCLYFTKAQYKVSCWFAYRV